MEPYVKNRHEKRSGICVFDPENPQSVYNLVTDAIRARIDCLNLLDFEITERRLRQKLKPDPRDLQIRISFWNEYHAAIDKGRPMMVRKITHGVCTDAYFYNTYLYDKNRLIFMLMPVSSFEKAQKEVFYTLTDKVRQIAELPLMVEDKNGNLVPDYKLIPHIMRAQKQYADRLYGSAIQSIKIDQTQKSLNLNVKGDVRSLGDKSIEDINQEIAMLEGEIKEKRSSVDAEVIEVEGESES